MKPKLNRKVDHYQPKNLDYCQSPSYALDPLMSYLPQHWVIWEPAMGEGNLYNNLIQRGYQAIGGDILTGQDFFRYEPIDYDCQVTNPPYGLKYEWLARCYELGKPFALLMPTESLAAGQAIDLYMRYGVEVIQPNRRIDFKMPHKGYGGNGAQFSTAWFTWGLNIGQPLTFYDIPLEVKREHKAKLERAA